MYTEVRIHIYLRNRSWTRKFEIQTLQCTIHTLKSQSHSPTNATAIYYTLWKRVAIINVFEWVDAASIDHRHVRR